MLEAMRGIFKRVPISVIHLNLSLTLFASYLLYALPTYTLIPVQSSDSVSISVIGIRIAPRVPAISSAVKREGHEMPEKNKYYSPNNCSYQVNWRICFDRVIWNTRNDNHLCHN